MRCSAVENASAEVQLNLHAVNEGKQLEIRWGSRVYVLQTLE